MRARAFLKAHPGLRVARSDYTNALWGGLPVAIELGDHEVAAATAKEWAQSALSDFRTDELGGPVLSICEFQLKGEDEAPKNAGSSPRDPDTGWQANFLMARAVIREALGRGLKDPRILYRLADLLTAAPEGLRDPELALRLARRAAELKPGDQMCEQSLGWALYRSGDWKGCIETLEKHRGGLEGVFILGMAYWQSGRRDAARVTMEGSDEFLKTYEKSCEEKLKRGRTTHPTPAMLRRLRAEAMALMGMTPAQAGGKPGPARGETAPPIVQGP
jgi:tetratricopeptide (TPR) repeat protein